MCDLNPVPVLQTVALCGKLQEVAVRSPKHCEVGMRCAYKWMYRLCVSTVHMWEWHILRM